MPIFQFEFMRNAFMMTILLSIACACIGHVIVLRGLSMTSDALSHAALAGVTMGLILGVNPTLAALIVCMILGLVMEGLRTAFPQQADLATSIILSFGIGLAGILASRYPGGNLQSYLFGSLVAIRKEELYLVLGLTLVILLVYGLMYRELFHLSFDPQNAKLMGIPVRLVSAIFMVLTGLTVAVASRTAGTLIVSSLLTLPFATALRHRLNYKGTLLAAMAYGIFNSIIGLFVAFYGNFATGGSIVMVSLVTLACVGTGVWLRRRHKARKSSAQKP